jgi:mannose-6-phosphate isomerase-like protein (cupin superfamily)
MPVIPQDSLPFSVIAREFVGKDHGGVGVCILMVDAPPGRGPSLHRHPYDEIVLIQEGHGTFTIGDEQLEAGAGDLVIVPANQPHAFVNTGDGPLRQIDIHVSPHFSTEWLTG